ncbi:hypothetical protein [Actinoplanes sp. L3-i22]|uniref:hypothetical protein n=1 Tax=Actinoplanes sp. L3-i22 TaxID=2836373 RepID=UPI001C84E955|nr:hypothetical protein [Actinoplanes sp. L3-i22]
MTLAVSLPLGVYLLMRGPDSNRAGPAQPPPVASPSSPVPSVSGTGPSTRPAAPDGHITLATLREATLYVPRWPADNTQGPSGRVRFHNGSAPVEQRIPATGQPPYGSSVVILSVAYGDVDRDGADETVVELGCLNEGGSKQLVAYDRDRAGHIVAVGQVAATTGQVRDIRTGSARVAASGTVTALVGDYQRCCDDQTPQTWQTRGYALRHGRFEQVAGPTRMPVDPYVTECRITAGDLVLGPVTAGYRYGTLDVRVTHRWGVHTRQVTLWFYPPAGLERAGTGWPPVTVEPTSFSVTVPAPAAGGSADYTFAFRRAATAGGGELTVELATVPQKSEAIPWNNGATAAIRTVN